MPGLLASFSWIKRSCLVTAMNCKIIEGNAENTHEKKEQINDHLQNKTANRMQ